MPAPARRSVYLIDTYCDPRSLWWTKPSFWAGRRSCKACSSASRTKPACIERETRQPTIRRQERARRCRQDAVHRRGRNDHRAQAEADQAENRQGLSQEGGRALRQGRDRAQEQCCQRRSVLLASGHQGGRRSLPDACGFRTNPLRRDRCVMRKRRLLRCG